MEKTPRGEMPEAQNEGEPRTQSVSAEVTGYGSPRHGSPPPENHLVAYHYREVEQGVLQPVLREGTPWTLDGAPIQQDKLPAHWRAEVYKRMPDEEHGGWKWQDAGELWK